jgi:hypothetical protein
LFFTCGVFAEATSLCLRRTAHFLCAADVIEICKLIAEVVLAFSGASFAGSDFWA